MTTEIPTFQFQLDPGLKKLCEGSKLNPEDFLPKKANPTDNCYDCRVAEAKSLIPGVYFKLSLGFKVFCPPGWGMLVKARSSAFIKQNLVLHPGEIDEEYEGTMGLLGFWFPDNTKLLHENFQINFGDRLAQLNPIKIQNMNVESVSVEQYKELCSDRGGKRGSGGYGSTGNH